MMNNQHLPLFYVLMLRRWLPLGVAFLLLLLTALMWPDNDYFVPIALHWMNIVLLLGVSLALFIFVFRSFNQQQHIRTGSYLRTKLVTAMVLMVLVPAVVLQITANQVIEKGMDVWFDVRVDTLLDKAMNLAQVFYARVESDMATSLEAVAANDEALLEAATLPLGSMGLSHYLNTLLGQHQWTKVETFDVSGRVTAVAQRAFQGQSLNSFKTRHLSETGKVSIALGHYTIEHETRDDGEYMVGYLPLYTHRRFEMLLRAEVQLPEGVVSSARSIETDYRTYRALERHRQGIQDTFRHTLMMVTILIMCFAGFFAVLFARKLTMPIEALAKALKKVEGGDFDALVSVHSRDELGSLAASFNSMTMRLQNNVSALQQTQLELTDALVSSRQRRYVLETLLQNLQSGVILLEQDGHIRLINQTCQQLFSLEHHQLEKTSMFDFTEAHLSPVLDFYQHLHAEQQNTLQHEFELSFGQKTVRVLARGTLLGEQEDSLFKGWLLVFDDVTQLAEMQKHQAWSEVAQRLAHEIKNPLTPIKLSTERLQRRFRHQVDDEAVFDTCTHAVISQVERLQRLLSDFSDLATLPKPKIQRVSIASLLQELRELYSAYHDLCFEGLPEGDVYCDVDQIRQVLINLIDNALATQSLVRVFVEITTEHTCFYVQDQGVGIDESTQRHMFEAYFSTKKRGSGLGLAIAQRITEEHHGQLLLLSAAAPTCFCMQLPHVHETEEVN